MVPTWPCRILTALCYSFLTHMGMFLLYTPIYPYMHINRCVEDLPPHVSLSYTTCSLCKHKHSLLGKLYISMCLIPQNQVDISSERTCFHANLPFFKCKIHRLVGYLARPCIVIWRLQSTSFHTFLAKPLKTSQLQIS